MKIVAAKSWMVAAAGVSVLCAPVASADESLIHTLGSAAEVTNGDILQAWTIGGLMPSSDVIPYSVTGTLWEATATDLAVHGTVAPIVSNLNARARSGQTYRVLFGVATPQGVNPSTLPQGQKTTGKVYFDVTGDTPDSVVYNAGGADLVVWVQPPPAPSGLSSTGSGSGSVPPGTGASAAAPTGGAVAASPTTPAGTDSLGLPEGSQGTPLPPVSQGTPLPPVSQGTPIPSTTATATPSAPTNAAATPAPAASEQTPAPTAAGSTPPSRDGQVTPSTTAVVAPPAS